MLISRRLVIGLLLVLALSILAIMGPAAGGTASADGGDLYKGYVYVSSPQSTSSFAGIRCEDDECLRLTSTSLVLSKDGGIVGIRCEDDECLRLTSTSLVLSKDSGFVGIRCEDDECL